MACGCRRTAMGAADYRASRPSPVRPRPGTGIDSALPSESDLHPWLEPPQARIEQVADTVAEQVEAEHCQHQRGAGGEHRPGRAGQVLARVAEHVAPTRDLRRGTGTKETEAPFTPDRV